MALIFTSFLFLVVHFTCGSSSFGLPGWVTLAMSENVVFQEMALQRKSASGWRLRWRRWGGAIYIVPTFRVNPWYQYFETVEKKTWFLWLRTEERENRTLKRQLCISLRFSFVPFQLNLLFFCYFDSALLATCGGRVDWIFWYRIWISCQRNWQENEDDIKYSRIIAIITIITNASARKMTRRTQVGRYNDRLMEIFCEDVTLIVGLLVILRFKESAV